MFNYSAILDYLHSYCYTYSTSHLGQFYFSVDLHRILKKIDPAVDPTIQGV